MTDRVVDEAQAFADTMTGLQQRLSPQSILAIAATTPAANRRPS